jgi:hypothetical protein
MELVPIDQQRACIALGERSKSVGDVIRRTIDKDSGKGCERSEQEGVRAKRRPRFR